MAFPLPERPGFGQLCDARIVIAERLVQHRFGVLAEQGRCDRIYHRRQFHAQRRFDIGDRARGRVRDPAEAMTLAHFRCVEPLLDGTKIADRNIGLLHLRDPVLQLVARKNLADDGAQLFPVGGSRPAVGEFRIGDQVGPVKHLGDETPIQPVVGASDIERPVGRFIDPDTGRAVRRVAETAGIHAVDQIGHAVKAGHRHRNVDQRDLDMLAAAEPVACQQRKQDGIAGRHARRQVYNRRTGAHRLAVRKAVQRHEAAFGLRDRVEARTQGKRSLAAVGRDRAIDQPRVGRRDVGIVETELLHHAAGEILHHHIRFRDQFARDLERRGVGEVERDAALVAIEAEIGRTLAADFRVLIAARIVAAVRVFDLDDVGAEIGQGLRAGRSGNNAGEIHHQQAVERGWHALLAGCAIRQLRSGRHDRFVLFF